MEEKDYKEIIPKIIDKFIEENGTKEFKYEQHANEEENKYNNSVKYSENYKHNIAKDILNVDIISEIKKTKEKQKTFSYKLKRLFGLI
jgi:hypothetical protein